jgi:hypothetical protein
MVPGFDQRPLVGYPEEATVAYDEDFHLNP